MEVVGSEGFPFIFGAITTAQPNVQEFRSLNGSDRRISCSSETSKEDFESLKL